jgi:hypothetical protein
MSVPSSVGLKQYNNNLSYGKEYAVFWGNFAHNKARCRASYLAKAVNREKKGEILDEILELGSEYIRNRALKNK